MSPIYICQFLSIQLIFYVLYEWLLKKETFFTANRWYLILVQIVSITLPLLDFHEAEQYIPVETLEPYSLDVYNALANQFGETFTSNTSASGIQQSFFDLSFIWKFGILIAAVLFLFRLSLVLTRIQRGSKNRMDDYFIIRTNKTSEAFSFFNYIFIPNETDEAIAVDIILHESIHIQQQHSIDKIFFEILKIIFWWNPLVYLFQKKLSENHEYYVDDQLASNQENYSQNLLAHAFSAPAATFVNPFLKNSLLKKRLDMIRKDPSKKAKLIRYSIAIPLLIASVTFIVIYNNTPLLWNAPEYKTGDEIASLNYVRQYQNGLDNYMEFTNNSKEVDVVIKIIHADSNTLYRDIYVKKNSIGKIKNVPLGEYFLKIAYGNDWRENGSNGIFLSSPKYVQVRRTYPMNVSITNTPWGSRAMSPIITLKQYLK